MTEVLRLEARRCWFTLGIGGSCGKSGAEQVASSLYDCQHVSAVHGRALCD